MVGYLESSVEFLNGFQKKDSGAGLAKNLLSDYPSYLHIYEQMDAALIVEKTKERIMRLHRDHYLKVRAAHLRIRSSSKGKPSSATRSTLWSPSVEPLNSPTTARFCRH